MNNIKIRFGIVGTGVIAHRFAEAIKNVGNAELVAVASRTKENAEKFNHTKILTEEEILKTYKSKFKYYLGSFHEKRGVTFEITNDLNNLDKNFKKTLLKIKVFFSFL